MKQVTITGVDDYTDIEHLKDLQAQYPFVEWGVLWSRSKCGTLRYPSMAFREIIANTTLNLSAHFCGAYAREVMDEQTFVEIQNLPLQYKRVQLNYRFPKGLSTPKYKYSREALLHFLNQENIHNRCMILQNNFSNSKAVVDFLTFSPPPTLHILHDTSGGKGVVIKVFPNPLKRFTGYAGGIGPENVLHIAQVLSVYNEHSYYIDMESNVRTDNKLDLEKVENVLKQVQPFIK